MGQYRPIVVNKTTKHILSGNHTYQGAVQLGWEKIAVHWVDVDDVEEIKILIVDNRTSDLATYDPQELNKLLMSTGLRGTGFTQSEVDTLDRLMNGKDKDNVGGSKSLPSDPEVKISAWKFTVEMEAYKAWKEQLYVDAPTKQKAIKEIKTRLGLPERKPVEPEPNGERSNVEATDIETVLINEIKVHPLNPREGDIGSIIESLTHMGQYRPIVVNKTTKHILSGNHTYQGAVQLGWEKIAVHWVDVDEVEEIKILIVDNRTSDLATYDPQELNKLLTSTGLRGTGFSSEEVAEILSGGKSKPGHIPVGRTTIRVGEHNMRVHTEDLNEWANTINGWKDVAELLFIPIEACEVEEN